MVQTLSSLENKTKSINSDTVQKAIQATEQKHLQSTAPQNPTPSFKHPNTGCLKRWKTLECFQFVITKETNVAHKS